MVGYHSASGVESGIAYPPLADATVVSGNVLLFRRDLYSHPYPSRNLHIGYYIESFRSISGVPDGKAFLFPLNSEFVLLPLASNPI